MDKVSSIEAKAKIDPRIGPIQGVHPNPKANPIVYGNKMFCDFLASNLFSKFKYPIFINPINCNEIIIIIIVKATTGLRVDPSFEEEGLDISSHGETNYRQ